MPEKNCPAFSVIPSPRLVVCTYASSTLMLLLLGRDTVSQPNRKGSILALRLISDSLSEKPRGRPCASSGRTKPGIAAVDGSCVAADRKPFRTADRAGLNAFAVTGGAAGGGGGGIEAAACSAVCAAIAAACAAEAAVCAAAACPSAVCNWPSRCLLLAS